MEDEVLEAEIVHPDDTKHFYRDSKGELVRVARPGVPAKDDPARNPDGTVRKGSLPAVPRKKKSRGVFARAAAAMHHEPASSNDRQVVADQLGLEHVGAIPTTGPDGESMTVGGLLAWFMTQRALRGSIEAFREIADRTDPKPKRLEVTGDGLAVRMAVSAGESEPEREAADAYFERINED